MYNHTLAQMNQDRALAKRQAKERAENPPERKYCKDCGAFVPRSDGVFYVDGRAQCRECYDAPEEGEAGSPL